MIELICTHCRATLEMDDGFAGGACRCQHCGTIQTVPSRLKNKNGAPKKTRTLYQNRPEPAVPSSGLDQLADVVASSGLNSARLRKAEAKEAAVQQRHFKAVVIVASCIIAILSGIVIWLATRNSGVTPPTNMEISDSPPPKAAAAAQVSPSFCGLPLDGQTIIYLLDRGDSTRDSFGNLKTAVGKSLATLGPNRKFQILFWNNGSDDSLPEKQPVNATGENISIAEHAMEEIVPHGKTEITSAMKRAMAGQPSQIIIVTGKAWDLDDSFVKTIDNIRGDQPVKIQTVSLGDPRGSTALQVVGAKTGGVFKAISDEDLKTGSE